MFETMSQIREARVAAGMPEVEASLRVLLVVAPSTSVSIADATMRGSHAMTVDSGGVAALSPAMTGLQSCDVVVVEIDPARTDQLAAFERFARNEAAFVPVIAAVRDLSVSATRLVMRAGATDVVRLPFSAAEVTTITAAERPALRVVPAAVPVQRGKIVAFVGALGGCGTTALTTQAGIIWAATARVCLIDLDLQFGNAALYLDLPSGLGVGDILEAGTRLDAELLRTIAQTHSSGLNIIASPPELMPLDTLTAEAVDRMLTLATHAFDIVLVDLPSAWTTWSMRVVEMADVSLMVTSLSVPGIHQARRQSEIIAVNGFSDRLQVVVNRVVHPMFGKVDLTETQSLLGRRIDHTIANDYPTVSTAIDRGKPFAAIKAKTRVEKDIRAMVASLTATLHAEPTT